MRDFHITEFSRYTREEIETLTEINPDAEIKLHQVDGIKYIRATNFLKRPDDLAEFMSKFPAEDKNLTVAAGQKADVGSSAPGFQQYIRNFYFRALNKNLFKIGYDLKLHKYNQKRTEFDNFTNCCYPGMKAYHKNYLPHTDRFGIAANMYLTDPGTPTSTSFFRLRTSNGTLIHNEFELSRAAHADIKDIQDRYVYDSSEVGWEPWVKFKGNDFYEYYYDIPAEYNSMSMYRGNIWHSITYDASEKSKVRYSLVTAMLQT